jgi:hypothetical protein
MEEYRETCYPARNHEGHLRHHHADPAGNVGRRAECNRMAAGFPVLGKGLPYLNSRADVRLVAGAAGFAQQRLINRLARGETIGVLL